MPEDDEILKLRRERNALKRERNTLHRTVREIHRVLRYGIVGCPTNAEYHAKSYKQACDMAKDALDSITLPED